MTEQNPTNFTMTEVQGGNAITYVSDDKKYIIKVEHQDHQGQRDSVVCEALALYTINCYTDHCRYNEIEHIFPLFFSAYFSKQQSNGIITSYVGNMALFDILTDCSKSKRKAERRDKCQLLLSSLSKMMQLYIDNYGSKIDMSHNDMTTDNVRFDDVTNRFYIIDFGRVFFNPEKVPSEINSRCIDDICNDYNISKQKLNCHDNVYSIKGEYGYLCDLATLSLNVLPYMYGFVWPEWLQVVYELNEATNKSEIYLNVDLRKKSGHVGKQQQSFYTGLAWLGFCCKLVLQLPDNRQSRFPLAQIQEQDVESTVGLPEKLLFSNNTFNPLTFNTKFHNDIMNTESGWKAFQKQFCINWNNITSTQTAGNPPDIPASFDSMEEQTWNKTLLASRKSIHCVFGHGGSSISRKHYRVHTEKTSKRRYILFKGHKWYLDENNSRYRYCCKTTRNEIFLASTVN